jgi:hypothetical protein
MDSNITNIEQYYQQVKDKYDMDFVDFKIICSSPFIFLKKIMSSGVLKNIRLQYLGTFEVSPSRVMYSKKTLQQNYDNNLISKERYEQRMKILNNYELQC